MVDYTLNSLTRKAKASVLVYTSKFTVDGIIVWGLLWKQIVSVPSLDTKLTARNLRTLLRSLPEKIAGTDIATWNTEFRSTFDELLARDETIEDPEDIIFNAYLATSDSRFNEYFKLRKDERDDGLGPLADADCDEIMAKGLEKYNTYEDD